MFSSARCGFSHVSYFIIVCEMFAPTIVVGSELLMRAVMSALFVYPCEYQRRKWCCVEYSMPRFWIVVLVLVCVNTLIAGTLGALLFFVDVGYPKLDLSRIAVLFGTSLLQVILAASCFVVSKKELKSEELQQDEEGL